MARSSFAYVIVFAAIAAYSPYVSPYYQSLGIGLGQIGLLTAMAAAVGLVAAPLWGAVDDRVAGSRVILPLAAALAALGALGIAVAGRSPLLIASVATFAIGMAGLTPLMDVRVLDLVRADRSRYGLVRAWGSASFMVATPLVGLLMNAMGRSAFFYPLVGAFVTAAVVLWTFPVRTGATRAPAMRQAPARVLRDRSIALFLLGSLVAWTAMYLQLWFLSIYLTDLGASNDRIGWAWSLGALCEVPVMLLFPRIAAHVGTERLLVLGAAILTIREIANVAFTASDVLVAVSLFQGTGYALLLVGGVTFVSEHAPAGTAATAQGILSGASISLASILGSGLGGFAASALTMRGMFAAAAALGLLAIALIAAAVLPGARLGKARTPGDWPHRAEADATSVSAAPAAVSAVAARGLPRPVEPPDEQ